MNQPEQFGWSRYGFGCALLHPNPPIVLLLSIVKNQIADDKLRDDREEGAAYPPKSVGDTSGDESGKGTLLEGGEVVLGGASDLKRN